jgi:RNA polymerase sigma-70 factor (ECF subfamily)
MPHLDAAYSLARCLVSDPLDAEDITQDALLRAFRGLDGLRGDAAKPWLMTIVRNACLAYRRRNRSWGERAVCGMDDFMDTVANPDAKNPEGVAIRQGDIAMLRAAIQALPESLSEALVLRERGSIPTRKSPRSPLYRSAR